jgi:hypothetical protein
MFIGGRAEVHSETCRSSVPLVSAELTLWSEGRSGSHERALRLPFEFTLPASLPAGSFQADKKGTISFALEVTAKRHGLFHGPRRAGQVFGVLAAATPAQLDAAARLRAGWAGQWREVHEEKQIRKGIWGDHSRVQAQVGDAAHVVPTGPNAANSLRAPHWTRSRSARQCRSRSS